MYDSYEYAQAIGLSNSIIAAPKAGSIEVQEVVTFYNKEIQFLAEQFSLDNNFSKENFEDSLSKVRSLNKELLQMTFDSATALFLYEQVTSFIGICERYLAQKWIQSHS